MYGADKDNGGEQYFNIKSSKIVAFGLVAKPQEVHMELQ